MAVAFLKALKKIKGQNQCRKCGVSELPDLGNDGDQKRPTQSEASIAYS